MFTVDALGLANKASNIQWFDMLARKTKRRRDIGKSNLGDRITISTTLSIFATDTLTCSGIKQQLVEYGKRGIDDKLVHFLAGLGCSCRSYERLGIESVHHIGQEGDIPTNLIPRCLHCCRPCHRESS